jgi:tripartite-type tricarboxylate transporter receptor subunit TctC
MKTRDAEQIDGARRRGLARGMVWAAALVGLDAAAQSHGWVPDKPVRLIVPFPAGGGADVAARIVAQAVGGRLGQPMIVENRGGAGGAIGSQVVQVAPPDGCTLLVGSADTHSIYPHVYAKPLFQATEFVAVAPITRIAYVLMGRPDLPARSVADVVALSRKGQLSYASWGPGSAAHAAMSLFTGVAHLAPMLHVPYTGAAPASQALMASQVDLMMVPMPLAVASRSKLSVFGVSAMQRSDALKDVPTLSEQGYAVDAEFWIGLLAPAKTPQAAVDAISSRVHEAVSEPEVQARLLQLGMTPHRVSQPEFAAYVAGEYARWGRVIKSAGIKIDE